MLLDNALDSMQGVKEAQEVQNNEKKQLTPVEMLYKRIESIGINMDELRGILDCADNQLILSGAGSGKTTALILKLIKGLVSGEYMKTIEIRNIDGVQRVQVPKRIFVGTFLKTGAEELEKAFGEMCRKLGISGLSAKDITFSTLHAEFYAALKEMGVSVDIEVNNQKNLRAILNKYSIKNKMSYSKNLTMDEIRDCECIIAYARNRLDDKRFQHPLMSEYDIDSIMMPLILEDLKMLRRAHNKMDFEDLQELLYEYSKSNANIAKFLASRYDIILLDEFQDTAQIQYEVLKHYIRGCETVIAIGDDDQTIYSWRGSDVDIINSRFEKDFNPVVKQLTVNYRCAKNILNPVIPSIESNKIRHKKELKGFHEGGSVVVKNSRNVEELIKGVKEDIAQGYNVGILSRTNFDLLMPAILLELDESIDFVMNKTISMSTRVCQQVFGVMDLVTKRYTPEFEEHLSLFVNGYNKRQARTLADIIKMNKEYNIFNVPIRDIKFSTPALATLIENLRDKEKKLGKVEAYLYLIDVLEKEVYKGRTPYAQKARDLCGFVKTLIRESELCKGMDIGEINELFTIVLPERLRRRTNMSKNSKVKITTVHEAKGKEWDSVYIWNDTDGTFPASVGKRDLTDEEFEEERRVHYIAWTRAKKKLTVFTDVTKMSPFLMECKIDNDIEDTNDKEDVKVEKIANWVYKRGMTYDGVKEIIRKRVDKILEDSTRESYTKVETILYYMSVEELIDKLTDEVWDGLEAVQANTSESMYMKIAMRMGTAINNMYATYNVDEYNGVEDEDY